MILIRTATSRRALECSRRHVIVRYVYNNPTKFAEKATKFESPKALQHNHTRRNVDLSLPLPVYPMRLSLSIAKEWQRSGNWDPAKLEMLIKQRQKYITVKTSSKTTSFMYTENGSRPMLLDTDQGEFQTVDMCPTLFFEQISNSDRKPENVDSVYFTDLAANLGILDILPGWEQIALKDSHVEDPTEPACTRSTISCWIGGKRVTTQTHYDVANNVFIQLHGIKKFTFYHPSEASYLYLYPDAHPRARKSQVDFERPDLSKFPLFSKANIWTEMVLKPGDAIYIPAFWFHRVKCLSPSVSVNCFSESSLKQHASDIFNQGLPSLTSLRYKKDMNEKKAIFGAFVEYLTTGLSLPGTFAEMLLNTRYSSVYASSSVSQKTGASFSSKVVRASAPVGKEGSAEIGEQPSRKLSNNLSSDQLSLGPTMSTSYTNAENHKLKKDVQRIVDMFNNIDAKGDHSESYRMGVVNLVASHFVELWLIRSFGMKNAKNVLRSIQKNT